MCTLFWPIDQYYAYLSRISSFLHFWKGIFKKLAQRVPILLACTHVHYLFLNTFWVSLQTTCEIVYFHIWSVNCGDLENEVNITKDGYNKDFVTIDSCYYCQDNRVMLPAEEQISGPLFSFIYLMGAYTIHPYTLLTMPNPIDRTINIPQASHTACVPHLFCSIHVHGGFDSLIYMTTNKSGRVRTFSFA